jgi:hypothetical protein
MQNSQTGPSLERGYFKKTRPPQAVQGKFLQNLSQSLHLCDRAAGVVAIQPLLN